jgi:hypothetical protein
VSARVALDPRAARAWPALRGIAFAHPGTVIVGSTGEVVCVRYDGGLDEILPGGVPRAAIASDQCARAA